MFRAFRHTLDTLNYCRRSVRLFRSYLPLMMFSNSAKPASGYNLRFILGLCELLFCLRPYHSFWNTISHFSHRQCVTHRKKNAFYYITFISSHFDYTDLLQTLDTFFTTCLPVKMFSDSAKPPSGKNIGFIESLCELLFIYVHIMVFET